MYILGYIPKDNKLYLSDKDMNVVGYSLLLSVLEYQTAVMREDFDTAKQVRAHSQRRNLHRLQRLTCLFLETKERTTEQCSQS